MGIAVDGSVPAVRVRVGDRLRVRVRLRLRLRDRVRVRDRSRLRVGVHARIAIDGGRRCKAGGSEARPQWSAGCNGR